jgi:hypothetical protein
VARDGIEPPPPAFLGLLTDSAKWFKISASFSSEGVGSISFRIDWDGLGRFRLFDVPVLFPFWDAQIVAPQHCFR